MGGNRGGRGGRGAYEGDGREDRRPLSDDERRKQDELLREYGRRDFAEEVREQKAFRKNRKWNNRSDP